MADPSLADPLDSAFFSDLPLSLDNLDDIDFTFDDINLPSDTQDFLNSLPVPTDPVFDLDSLFFSPDSDEIQISGDVADFLNVSSPDSALNDPARVSSYSPVPVSCQGSGNLGNSESKNLKDSFKVSDYAYPGSISSQGSGNSGNSVPKAPKDPYKVVSDYASPEPASSQCSGDSGNSASPVSDFSNNSMNGVVDQKIKLEEGSGNSVLKRKKGSENSDSLELRTSKYRRSNTEGVDGISDDDEKRKARLMRNRESAQLSRQRKKHYVEELEDKVRAMHSTIQDLNSRISYIMAENASLRQQASGVPPPGVYPHPPMAPLGYPWIPCPSYLVKPQGSQVPLVPIPRLKPQQPAPAPKVKRNESKRSEGKTKKVASVSLLGLLFFMVLFGGLVPMVNVKFREMHESATGSLDYFNYGGSYDQQQGRVLRSVNGSDREVGIGKSCDGSDFVSKGHCGKPKSDGDKGGGNSSEPLVASLYVPRNDKLVKIDGNLIIHSVLASEKAMASNRNRGVKRKEETGLAVAHKNVGTIIPLTGRNRHPHPYRGPAERHRALSGEKDKLGSSPADGELQQWFREGLAGPMLSSGMCTEVFQFDISPAAGAIVPATSVVNASSETQHHKNITAELVKGRNRRILHGTSVPLVGSESNITEKPVGIDPEKDNFRGNSSLSSMVVSVLVDPREVGDGDGDGVMGPKSITRIFVVVLIDSVKYVTYSCMLPLIGSGAHLVTN